MITEIFDRSNASFKLSRRPFKQAGIRRQAQRKLSLLKTNQATGLPGDTALLRNIMAIRVILGDTAQ